MAGLVLKILGVAALFAGLAVGPQHVLQAQGGSGTEPTSAPAQADSTETEHDHSVPEASPASAPVEPAGEQEPARPIARLRALREGRDGGGTNFVSKCRYSHSAPDDPIVFPGQSGASHMHDFFANTSTNADSTYESLQAAGTTCRIEGDTAAYWVSALYDSGELVEPTHTLVYYRPGRKDNKTVLAFPAGLKVVAKDDNVRVNYGCAGRGENTNQRTAPTCEEGTHLVVRHVFPDCWDGKNLDSDNHTSHMSFARRGSCPSSHPTPVPAISVNVHYPSDGGEIVHGSPEEPVAPHADFFNAWDQTTLERLVKVCLNAGQHCGQRPPGT